MRHPEQENARYQDPYNPARFRSNTFHRGHPRLAAAPIATSCHGLNCNSASFNIATMDSSRSCRSAVSTGVAFFRVRRPPECPDRRRAGSAPAASATCKGLPPGGTAAAAVSSLRIRSSVAIFQNPALRRRLHCGGEWGGADKRRRRFGPHNGRAVSALPRACCKGGSRSRNRPAGGRDRRARPARCRKETGWRRLLVCAVFSLRCPSSRYPKIALGLGGMATTAGPAAPSRRRSWRGGRGR